MAGAVPVKGITSRADMDIAVLWKDEGGQALGDDFGAFVLGGVYQADITLSAKNGFSFDPAIGFRYPEGAVDAQPEDPLTVGERTLSTVVYKRTEAPLSIPPEDADLTASVPAPVTGTTLITSFYAGTYGGTVTWETGGEAAAGFFRAATEYTATLHLYARAGYTLTGSAFTYSGGGSLNDPTAWNNTGSSITGISIAFPATAGAAAVTVVTVPKIRETVAPAAPARARPVPASSSSASPIRGYRDRKRGNTKGPYMWGVRSDPIPHIRGSEGP